MIKNVCVFCGSSDNVNADFKLLGESIGKALVDYKLTLVYGGANVGVMGAMANKLLSLGGRAIGIMPKSLIELEVAHDALTEFIETSSMHARKTLMHEKSDLFVMLPGGMGTLDEFCETITWGQLHYHNKKTVVFNHKGFFKHFLNHYDYLIDSGFMSAKDRDLIIVVDTIDDFKNVLKEQISQV